MSLRNKSSQQSRKDSPKNNSKDIPLWRKKLYDRGLFDEAIEYFEIEPTEDNKGWIYPCQYPTGEVIYRIKRYPGINPRSLNPPIEELVDGEMPPFYHPHVDRLKDSIARNNGVLYGVEGEPDTQTLYLALEDENVIGFFGVNTVPKELRRILRKLGVKIFIYHTDIDHAGIAATQNIYDLLYGSEIAFNPRAVTYHLGNKDIKDINDLWMALSFDKDAMREKLSESSAVQPPTPEMKRQMREDASGFKSTLYEEIESRLQLEEDDFGEDGWCKNIPCIFHAHANNQKSPAFGWNRTDHFAKCFKCKKSWGARAVAQALGIDVSQYAKEPAQKNQNSQMALQPTTALASIRSNTGRMVDYATLDPASFLYTTDDIVDDYLASLRGDNIPDAPPLPFPFMSEQFSKLEGNTVVIEPSTLWLLVGKTGGFKTSFLSMIMSTWQHLGYHGIVVSPEWGINKEDRDSFIARQVQQLGGITMSQKSLLKRHYYEQKHNITQASRMFGKMPDQDDLERSAYYADSIIRSWEGKVGFVSKFGADSLEFLAMVEAAYHHMAADHYVDKLTGQIKEKQPTRPSWIMLDYLQLFLSPAGVRDWDMNRTINQIKELCLRLNVVGVVASQITKASSKQLAMDKSLSITEADAVNTRIDAFNLVTAIKITDDVDPDGNIRAYLDVIKNSTGRKGQAELLINGKTTNVMEIAIENRDYGDPQAGYKTVDTHGNDEVDEDVSDDDLSDIPFDDNLPPFDPYTANWQDS